MLAWTQSFFLLRIPSLSQAEDVVTYADQSLNSDLSAIRGALAMRSGGKASSMKSS